MYMYFDRASMPVGLVRFKPVVIVICFVAFYLCLQLVKLMYYVRNSHTPYTVSNNMQDGFVFSNDLVFKALQSARQRNCRYHVDDGLLRKICAFEKSMQFNETISDGELHYKRKLPGCIIIGTYKSGTRELIDFLHMHPQVVIRRVPDYEVAYFDKNVDKGVDWYRGQMPRSLPGQITVEKSPSYFYSEEAPRRIHEMNSSIKLILIVRQPLERALSEFTFDRYIADKQYGGSFYNCAVDPWSKKVNTNCFALHHSVYDVPTERYLEYFSRKQLLIIDADDLRLDPISVMKRVEDHLGVPHVINQDDFVYNAPRNIYCIQGNSSDSDGVCYDSNRGRLNYNVKLSNTLEAKLKAWFIEHNDRFFRLIGETFPWN